MSIERRFLLASSVARLIRREHPDFSRIVEGYFSPRSDRTQWVRVEREQSHLVLRMHDGGEARDEQLELPLSQASALMDVAAGRVAYDRTAITLSPGFTASVDRYLLPAGLDVLTVSVASRPQFFVPPSWAGREVTEVPEFDAVRLALDGLPPIDEIPVPNFALEALLNWLDRRFEVEASSRLEPSEAVKPKVGAEALAGEFGRGSGSDAVTTERAPLMAEEAVEVDDGVVRLARKLAPRHS